MTTMHISTLRKRFTALGYRVEKSRQRALHSNNKGGYQLIDPRNCVVDGVDFDMTEADLEKALERALQS